MMDKLCGWTETGLGKGVIAGTLIVVGLSHWGMLTGITDMSLPVVGSVGNLLGMTAVVSGVCLLGACCLPGSGVEE